MFGSDKTLERPLARTGTRRPISDFALQAIQGRSGNPRFKSENILSLELIMPERTTSDYEGPSVAPSVQQALEDALAEEEDITFNAV